MVGAGPTGSRGADASAIAGGSGLNRRGLLLAGAAGVLLAGCGDDGAPAPGADEDTRVLAGLLGLERRAVAIYARQDTSLSARLLAHEREHVARLEDALRGRRVSAAVVRGGDRASPLELARRLEETQLAAYQAALPRVRDPGLRRLLAGIAAVEAEHLSLVATALGDPPAPAAFVRGRDAL